MSMFFASANANQSLILETFGWPTLALRSQTCVPFPCCQDVTKFKTGTTEYQFESREFTAADGVNVSVISSATYFVDTSSRGAIMKAYKSYHKSEEKFSSRISLISSHDGDKETDVEDGIKEIISNIMIKKLKPMDFDSIVKIGVVDVDSIFQEAKAQLHFNRVELQSLSIKEFVEYVDVEDETTGVKHNECSDDKNDGDGNETSTFIMTLIPEDTSPVKLHTETIEINIGTDDSIAEESAVEIETSPEVDGHVESDLIVQLPVVTNEIEVDTEEVVSTVEIIEVEVLPDIKEDTDEIETSMEILAEVAALPKIEQDTEEIVSAPEIISVAVLPEIHYNIEVNAATKIHTTTTEIHESTEGDVSETETLIEVESAPHIHTNVEPIVSVSFPIDTNEMNTPAEIYINTTEINVSREGSVSEIETVLDVESTPDMHTNIKRVKSTASIQIPTVFYKIQVNTKEDDSTMDIIAGHESPPEIDCSMDMNTSPEIHTVTTEDRGSEEISVSEVNTYSYGI